MKKIKDLNLGYSDAQNYIQRSNKQMFSEVFVKNSYLDKLIFNDNLIDETNFINITAIDT